MSYDPNYAVVEESDRTCDSVIGGVALASVKSILHRINIQFEEGLHKDAYTAALADALDQNRELIVEMLPESVLDFLLDVWEAGELEIDDLDWDYLQYLRLFGLADFKRGNPLGNENNIIYSITQAKDRFYFYLKSRKTKKVIEEFERWEGVVTGLIYYYGLIDEGSLYRQFLTSAKVVIPEEEFAKFVKCRVSLWPIIIFLKDGSGRDFVQYVNVDNPEITLLYIREHKDLLYKNVSESDLFYIYENGGIDNRWKGITELSNLLLDEMNMDYYKTTVLVHTVISMIQNSCELSEVRGRLSEISSNDEALKNKLYSAAELLYYNIPIFEFKGHTRLQYQKMQKNHKESEKYRNFKLIK